MIDLSRTKEQMLAEINASPRAFANRVHDPVSAACVSLDEACFVVQGQTPDQLWSVLDAMFTKWFASVPADQLFADLTYPLKKGLGNAHKWGNQKDPAKNITVEAVVTKTGTVVSVSDEGKGFDAQGILSKIHSNETYFTRGGSGFHHFARTKSLISYTNGGRTLLLFYRCSPASSAAGFNAGEMETQNRLATDMRLAGTQVCFVSYPKSGHKWLRALIGKALCEKYQLDERMIFHEPRLTKAAGVLRTACTHGDAGLTEGRHYRDLETNLARYNAKKVLLMIRDPRDIVVSCYFNETRRKSAYNGSISDFIRSDHYGIRKIVTFYNIWHANRHIPEVLLPIRYEDLHVDPGKNLRLALSLIDPQDYTDEIIHRAVEYGSFKNMRRKEQEEHIASRKLQPGDYVDEESYKVRRGKVGGYVDYLDNNDLKYVNSVIDKLSCPLFLPS